MCTVVTGCVFRPFVSNVIEVREEKWDCQFVTGQCRKPCFFLKYNIMLKSEYIIPVATYFNDFMI